MKRLGSDLNTAQKEIKAKHKAYENAVGVLSRRLQEALAAKESSEAELNELKAQISESESNQASLVSQPHFLYLLRSAPSFEWGDTNPDVTVGLTGEDPDAGGGSAVSDPQ